MIDEPSSRRPSSIVLVVATAAVLVVTMLAMRFEGRRWWCACGQPDLWISETKSSHCSQHLLDAYSLTHFLHGMAFAGLLALTLPRLSRTTSGLTVLTLEAGWEALENSAFMIDRYRTGTAALGYEGDSIANSLGDIACCLLGWGVAVVVVVWALGYFPHGSGHLEQSWLASLGHLLEPVFRPMGADWRSAVGIVSFACRIGAPPSLPLPQAPAGRSHDVASSRGLG